MENKIRISEVYVSLAFLALLCAAIYSWGHQKGYEKRDSEIRSAESQHCGKKRSDTPYKTPYKVDYGGIGGSGAR